MKADISNFIKNLITVKNYAKDNDVSTSYIYKLIRENRMETVLIDGVHFIEADKYTVFPVENRRK
jgi:hypothetical protein